MQIPSPNLQISFRKTSAEKEGGITENYEADITIFSFDHIMDNAIYENPRQFPSWIKW